jgi:hypothetical protein
MEKLLSTVLLFAAIGLASCSDEIVDQNTVNPNEIRYKAVADIASRADSVYSQELKPLSFYLLSNIGGGITTAIMAAPTYRRSWRVA